MPVRYSELKEGDEVFISGFTCREDGKAIVMSHPDGLYIKCERGFHFLAGQTDDDDVLIGVSNVQVRPLVIIESPFSAQSAQEAGDNLVYLRRACRDSWDRGESPFASHGFYPLFLKDYDPYERMAGIEEGYRFWPQATLVVFYIDRGMSPGMRVALDRALECKMPHEMRSLKEGSTNA